MPRPVLTLSTSAINNNAMLLGNKVMTEEMNHKKNVNYLLIFLLFRPTSILGLKICLTVTIFPLNSMEELC